VIADHTMVLMAGRGRRFADAGFEAPKPLVKVHGRTILEWTLGSIPGLQNPWFAILAEHNRVYNLETWLLDRFGGQSVVFDEVTRGNLFTGELLWDMVVQRNRGRRLQGDLVFLDSDNKFDGTRLEEFIDSVPETPDGEFAVLCGFRHSDPTDTKWCFAVVDDPEASHPSVTALSEKKWIQGGFPMVGVFYFSKVALWERASREIARFPWRENGEKYMSQSVDWLMGQGVPVFLHLVNSVHPLGTPEDLQRFEQHKDPR
jgi:NDP-sugar pyrophosphorylase family protein